MPDVPRPDVPRPDVPRLDVLALAAHPDDVELCAGGTMCLLAKQGYRTGIVDFTRGELGTRGTPETRLAEAQRASEILGLAARENLGLPDGGLDDTPAHRLAVIRAVRRHRPAVVLLNAPEDRHPDHGHAARLAAHALFYAGLARIETEDDDGSPQAPWRPFHALHYMQAVEFTPTLVVDVTDVWEQRMAALMAFESQFGVSDGAPQTFIANPGFLEWVEARARAYGYRIGATYGEPLLYRHGPIGVSDLGAFLGRERPFR
ncbi:MAG: bacillithiol biosynthesis deacetylase BshB1 [Rubricoccaceae bacterium]